MRSGEVGFGYMTGMSASDNSGLPLLSYATRPRNGSLADAAASAALTFDSRQFGGSMVYLEISGAVKTLPISAAAATAGRHRSHVVVLQLI